MSRAAIESLAENFSDGVVAPVFWMAVAGLPGAAAYKAINTADSMIGHRTPRHAQFGFAAARLDDLVNLPASRLTGLLLVVAAVLMPGANPGAAWGGHYPVIAPPPPLAQCGLARGGHGRRARPGAGRTSVL